MIPDINELRRITEEANEADITSYMDKARNGIVNGIWQDAKNGLKYHIHVWGIEGKSGYTEGVRGTENFKEAIRRLKKEFEEAGYQFKINMKDRGFSTSVIENVHISWYKLDK